MVVKCDTNPKKGTTQIAVLSRHILPLISSEPIDDPLMELSVGRLAQDLAKRRFTVGEFAFLDVPTNELSEYVAFSERVNMSAK